MKKPKIIQEYPELWWRYTDPLFQKNVPWSFILYVADADGTLSGYYDINCTGKPETPRWDTVNFKRDDILRLNGKMWEFIGEIK